MDILKIMILASIALCFVLCPGCSGSEFLLTVMFPDLPKNWNDFECDSFILLPDKNGKIIRIPVQGDFIEIPKPLRSNYPILYFWNSELLAAGNWYCDGDSEIELVWERGMLSELILDMISLGYWPEQINIDRIQEKIEAKVTNPWLIDQQHLKDNCITGELGNSSIIAQPLYKADICFPEGIWISENPFLDKVDSRGTNLEFHLSEGISRWYCFEKDQWLMIFFYNNHISLYVI